MEAEITLDYETAKIARAIAEAISPDNFKTPNDLTVKTICTGKQVLSKICCRDKLPTFIATIDDLLFCTSTAEKTIQTAKRLE